MLSNFFHILFSLFLFWIKYFWERPISKLVDGFIISSNNPLDFHAKISSPPKDAVNYLRTGWNIKYLGSSSSSKCFLPIKKTQFKPLKLFNFSFFSSDKWSAVVMLLLFSSFFVAFFILGSKLSVVNLPNSRVVIIVVLFWVWTALVVRLVIFDLLFLISAAIVFEAAVVIKSVTFGALFSISVSFKSKLVLLTKLLL